MSNTCIQDNINGDERHTGAGKVPYFWYETRLYAQIFGKLS